MARSERRKRLRVESTSSHDKPTTPDSEDLMEGLTRGELWFEDGNIALIAETTVFRVHRGVLSLQCETFRDMFTASSPSTERFEGCDIVRLGDSPSELQTLLRASYGLMSFKPPIEFSTAETVIRLAHKYQAREAMDNGIALLKMSYPGTLKQWLALSSRLESEEPWRDDSHAPSRHIIAVQLAHLVDDPSILPVAYYRCCQLPLEALLSGAPRQDGTVARLEMDDMKKCMEGRARLMLATHGLLREMFDQGPHM